MMFENSKWRNPLSRVLGIGALLLLASCNSVPSGPSFEYQPRKAGQNPLPSWVFEGPIYEISLRPFTTEGTFAAAAKKLQEIKDLGVKTIWLEPFSPLGRVKMSAEGSIYCQKDKRGVDPMFGTLEDFYNFRDQAHALGMKVIVDVSLFHTSWDHPWMTDHNDWYERTEDGEIAIFRDMYADIPALRQDLPEVRQEMLELLIYWIKDQGLDGFRLDSASGVREDFWIWALPQVYKIKPILLLAELDAEPEAPTPVGPNLVYKYGNTLMPYWNRTYVEWLLTDMKATQVNSRGVAHMKFLAFHDDQREISPESLYADGAGLEGAAILTFTLPGVPRIVAGNEVGSLSSGSVTKLWKIDWAEKPGRRDFYKKIFSLWTRSEALREGDLVSFTDPMTPMIVAFERRFGNQSVKVAVNTTNKPLEYKIPGTWVNPQTQDLWLQRNWTGGTKVMLPPFGWIILGNS